MKYLSVIPLIGGFPLAAESVIGHKPQAVLSYPEFWNNDKLYLDYSKVPYYNINEFKGIDDNIDLVVGTPPCAGLSTAASHRIETTNDWMTRTASFVLGNIRPKIYVFENAPGLFTKIGTKCRDKLHKIGTDNGYSITFYKTDSLLHGLPQRRKRTYIIYWKGPKAPILNYYLTVAPDYGTYLSWKPISYKYDNLFATKYPYLNTYDTVNFVKKILGPDWRTLIIGKGNHNNVMNYIIDNGLLDDLYNYTDDDKLKRAIIHIKNKTSQGKGFRTPYGNVMIYDKYIHTVYGGNMWFMSHPTEDRILNIGEYMWMMGLPLDMEVGTKFEMIGQNVPILTTKDIIKECVYLLEGKGIFSNSNLLMQNNEKRTYNDK